MKKTDFSVLLRNDLSRRLKLSSRLLFQSLTTGFFILTVLWNNPIYSQGNCSLSCHDAQVSLGADCTAQITVAMIGDTSQCVGGDFVVYIITLQGDTIADALVGEDQIGMTLIASLVDLNSGNSCWSYITVADKMRPILVCVDDTISCLELMLSDLNQGMLPGVAPNLGAASSFALFTAAGAFNNVGAATIVTGDVGTHAGAFNAFPPGVLVGQKHVANAVSAQAATDVMVAYSNLAAQTCGMVLGVTLGNNQILTPDVYCIGAAATLNDTLILDGQGDPNAIFIFQIDGALSTSTFSNVMLINSASLCNVYWQVNGAFALGDSSIFRGTLISSGAISLLEGSSLFGRGLSTQGAISLQNNIVSRSCTPDFDGPQAYDNCTDSSELEIILLNETSELVCDSVLIKIVTRVYIARDASGNESVPCTLTLSLERIDFSLIDFPDSLTVADGDALDCDGAGVTWADANHDGIPDPLDDPNGPFPTIPGTGVPEINGAPIYPDFIGFCNALTTYEDVVLPTIGCVKKIMRVWTVREWHCSGETDTLYVQLIEIIDDEGPNLTCPLNFTHTTTGHQCTATVFLPAPLAVDDCGPVSSITITYPGGFFNGVGGTFVTLPVGVNVITYTAYDQCYNSSSCTMTVTVVDATPPIPVCDEHTVVSLTLGGLNGLTKVPAEVFDDGSYDACGPVTFLARRMDSCIDFDWTTNGAGIDEIPDGFIDSYDHGTVLRPKVPFACCDAGAGPIMIILEVTDASGNTNTCMVEVIVQDKIPPIITCPSDITLSCEYPIDLDNLGIFGDIVDDPADIGEWCIYDPDNPNNVGGFICGIDGLVIDNCDVTIDVEPLISINNCGVGYITRTFTASDANGQSTCTQTITIENFYPFTTEDIIWPLDFIGVECALGTDPDDLPPPYDRPIINEDQCDLIGINYDDLVFDIVDGACYKILRTWRVIEWCLYGDIGELVDGVNYWEHVQIIKVKNEFGPVFTTTQPTIEICNEFDCNGLFVELIQTAEDDCTPDELLENSYAIDLNNDGIIDYGPFQGFGSTIDASQELPLGTHRIIFAFEDRCGNRTVQEQIVILTSCKAPVPVCIHGLSTDLMAVDLDGDGEEETGMVTIWAQDWDASSYHPCGGYFVLSLAPDTNVQSLTFDCSHVGLGQIPVFLYATDELGNQAYCETYIIVQDNMGICPGGGILTGTITGNVSTETSDNVLNVNVELEGTAMLPITTNQSGTYTFPAMPIGGSYTVSPGKNNDFKNGVSTLDLVHIQKHLLGIKKLESPYKLIAADANDSKSITAVDLIELRRLILGIYSELPNNQSWRFVDKDYVFPDPYNPWMQVWPENHSLNPLSLGIHHVNFFGVKIGDVNNTVIANATTLLPRGSGEILDLVIDDQLVSGGDVIEVPVYAGISKSIEGLQFSFELESGLQLVSVKPGLLDVTADNFAWLKNRTLTSSWSNARAVAVQEQKPLFTLVLSAGSVTRLSESVSITSQPTQPEAYGVNNEILDLRLTFRGSEVVPSFELLQNEPNPFTGATQIGFIIPESGTAILTLFDVAGRQLMNQTINGIKGLNKVEINKDQINVEGMIYYQVQFQGYTATKKMLIL